jgi:hypothetical protein
MRALAQQAFQHERQHELLRLAQHGALARQQQVLGQLLGDGGAAHQPCGCRRASAWLPAPGRCALARPACARWLRLQACSSEAQSTPRVVG